MARSRAARSPALLCLLRPLLYTETDAAQMRPAPSDDTPARSPRLELRAAARNAA